MQLRIMSATYPDWLVDVRPEECQMAGEAASLYLQLIPKPACMRKVATTNSHLLFCAAKDMLVLIVWNFKHVDWFARAYFCDLQLSVLHVYA